MKALAFGEVLWDIAGDSETLGGAPLNVLGHIARLGGICSIISAVGDDDLGDRTISAAEQLGVDHSFLTRSEYPTGVASVVLEGGIPSYSFIDPCAWDDIKLSDEDFSKLQAEHYDVFIFGTLSSRHETSRNTLFRLLETIDTDEFFFDVNLRLQFYSDELIRKLLDFTTILKMNEDELPRVAAAVGLPVNDFLCRVQNLFPVRKILLTKGKSGSVCYEGDSIFKAPAENIKAVDTVGAGDSLSAAFLWFLRNGASVEESLQKAAMLADYVVSRRGAIPEYDEEIRAKLSKL